MTRTLPARIAVLLVAILVVTPAGAGAALATQTGETGASAPQPADLDAPENESDVEPADTIYVTEDGDAILEYTEESASTSTTTQAGLNVSENLLHLLVVNETDTEGTGSLTAQLTRSRFATNGSFAFQKPDTLETMSFEATAAQTDEQSTASMSLDATFTPENVSASGDVSVTTEGQARVSADTYSYSGTVTATGEAATATSQQDASVTLEETADGYRLQVDRTRTVYRWAKASWDTKANATESLRSQYGSLASGLDGESAVTLESYSFSEVEDGYYEVDLAYTVEYSGIQAAVTDRLTQSLAESENLTLSESEARTISERVQQVDIDRIHVAATTEGDTAELAWDVQIENYDELTYAILDVAESAKELDEDMQAQLDEARAKLEAREEAGLVRTVSWSGELAGDGETVSASFEMTSATENWEAYVAALDERGIDRSEVTYSITANTEGDQIVAEGELTVQDEQLVEQLTSSSLDSAEGDSEGMETVRAFQDAGFENAKVDVSMADGEVSFRAAAQFDDIAAFREVVDETYGGQVESIATRGGDGSSTTYVRVQGLAGENPSKEEIRSMAVADEDTTIKLPGEWDRTFPAMDVESVESFLGIEQKEPDETGNQTATTATTGSSDSGGLPGFGVPAALLALLGAAFVARRRD
jgi:PGF-CTERM protein